MSVGLSSQLSLCPGVVGASGLWSLPSGSAFGSQAFSEIVPPTDILLWCLLHVQAAASP